MRKRQRKKHEPSRDRPKIEQCALNRFFERNATPVLMERLRALQKNPKICVFTNIWKTDLSIFNCPTRVQIQVGFPDSEGWFLLVYVPRERCVDFLLYVPPVLMAHIFKKVLPSSFPFDLRKAVVVIPFNESSVFVAGTPIAMHEINDAIRDDIQQRVSVNHNLQFVFTNALAGFLDIVELIAQSPHPTGAFYEYVRSLYYKGSAVVQA